MADDYFPMTVWSQISLARKGQPSAMNNLLLKYTRPILKFIRLLDVDVPFHDPEDLLQQVLLAVSEPRFLQKADREKGRFRDLLRKVARNKSYEARRKARALKRGGGVRPLSLERDGGKSTTAPMEVSDPTAIPPDEEFDRFWITNLVRNALDRLEETSPRYADAIRMQKFGDLSQEELAARLGCTRQDVTNYVRRGKEQLRSIVFAEVKEYCSSPEEFAEELDWIRSQLG